MIPPRKNTKLAVLPGKDAHLFIISLSLCFYETFSPLTTKYTAQIVHNNGMSVL